MKNVRKKAGLCYLLVLFLLANLTACTNSTISNTGGESTTGSSLPAQSSTTKSISDAATTVSTTLADPSSTSKNSSSTTKVATVTTDNQEDTTMEDFFKPYLNKKPNVAKMPGFNPDSDPKSSANEWSNIEAITYDGADIKGQHTKVFAYIGFPEGASASKKVPAIVLVHGGGGHAFAEWIKLWTDRGYAAIAMDTTGFFPSALGKGVAGHEADSTGLWNYGLYGEFAQAGYANAPNNDEMQNSSKPLDEQWMYHAIISTMAARNILASDSRVDASKIGITGISWGGVITSLAIGYDPNYAFAIPVYGSGYLDEAHSWMGPIFSRPDTKKLWSAAARFNKVHIPVLWLGWSVDTAFSINSNSKSYDDTKAEGAILSMLYSWGHSHGQGWKPQEAFLFADSVVKAGPTMTTCKTEPKGQDISFTITPASDATKIKARAIYITQKLSYSSKTANSWPQMDQVWKAVDCTVEGNTVKGSVPKSTKGYYVELTTTTPNGKFVTTTRFVDEL